MNVKNMLKHDHLTVRKSYIIKGFNTNELINDFHSISKESADINNIIVNLINDFSVMSANKIHTIINDDLYFIAMEKISALSRYQITVNSAIFLN